MRPLASLLLLSAVAPVANGLAAGTARAEWPPPGDFRGDVPERPHVIFGEFGLFTTSGDAPFESSFTVASFLIGGYFRVAEPLELGVLVPFMYATGEAFIPPGFAVDGSQLHSGNPYVQAAYRGDFDVLTLRIGGGVTIPLAQFGDTVDPDDRIALSGLTLAAALRGLWDLWLWAPEQITVVIPNARLDFAFHENAVFAVESAFGVMISTNDADDETDVLWQIGVEGGGRLERLVELGLRLQLVTSLNSEGDQAQLSLTPFVRVELGAGLLEARLTMNLDDELGFAFDEGKVWGLRVLGGGRF